MSSNFERAQDIAARHGVTLTPADYHKISEVQAAARATVAARPIAKQTGLERWNDIYPRLLQGVLGIGDVLMMVTRTLILAFGVPAALVLLLIVEQQRVVHGILLFEAVETLAHFAAWVLVLSNLILEFNVHYVEQKAGYVSERAQQFSLRLWWQSFQYAIGAGANWQPVDLSPAQRQRKALRIITLAILALSLGGSMRSLIASTPGAWHEALRTIVQTSSLADMSTWAGGLLFALFAVMTAQVVTRYVAVRCVEIAASMTITTKIDDTEQAADAAAAHYVQAKVSAALEKKAGKNTDKIPFGNSVPTAEEPEYTPTNAPAGAYRNAASDLVQ